MNAPESTLEAVRNVLAEALGIDAAAVAPKPGTPLFGSLPELDSMAVIALITALEEKFGITVDDSDVTAELFDTLGSLSSYVDGKRAR